MRLALEAAEVEVEVMAGEIGVTPQTIHNYLRGTRTPILATIKQWARICQVPWQWIVTGELPDPDDDGAELSKRITQREQSGIFGDIPRLLKLVA